MGPETIHISHIDLDGYGCSLFMRAQRIASRHYNVDYKDLEETLKKLPKESHVFITDLSATEDMRELLESFDKITFIDHHDTSMWMNDRPLKNSVYTKVSTDRCATYLLYLYFADMGLPMNYEWYQSYADLIDDYDRWVHSMEDSKRLNFLLYISNKEYLMGDALRMSATALLAKNKDRIDRYVEQVNTYVNETPIHVFNGIGIAFAEKYKSHIADACFKKGTADLIYIIDARTGMISIRSSKDSGIDCSKIAEKYLNGGGHFNASGGRIDMAEVQMDDAFIYLPMMPGFDKVKKEESE